MAKTALLTPRQAEVVALLRRGDTNKEIAAHLGISDDAVKAHLSRLYLRFGVSNRVALLGALGSQAGQEFSLAGDLGQLRSVASRLRDSSSVAERSEPARADGPIESLRQALAAVDAALDLVNELPDETKGQVIEAVRHRLGNGFAALDALQRSLEGAPRSVATR